LKLIGVIRSTIETSPTDIPATQGTNDNLEGDVYLIRRVYKVKPGTTRKAAGLIHQIGKVYEEAGQRPPVRVYWSGSTMPGPANTVYMDWVQEKIESPYRQDHELPDTSVLGQQLRELQEESYIEFYEMYVPL
jgi:hypothetical protein